MESLLDEAPCGFLSFADDGIITYANTTLGQMLGYSPAELTGKSIDRIFTVGTRIFYQTHLFPLVRMHGRADEIFLILRCADGSDAGVLTNTMRRERDGKVVNDCVLMRVRERQKFEAELLRARREAEESQRRLEEANKELEESAAELEISTEELQVLNEQMEERMIELERLREKADEANVAKSDFLAMMSHELRTPLNAIAGYAQLLEMGVQGPVSETQKESLQRIQQSQRHLLRLVNEILNLARIESGHVEYDIQEVTARELMSRILPLVEPQMLQNSLSLEVHVPDSMGIRCDVEKTVQILLNLLSNAIKFTRAGGTITVSATRAVDDGDTVAIAVEDSGIGIPADMIDAIFDPFVQVEVSRSRRGEGTGLGLAISRDLAQGMNGSLTATSTPGVGSTFRLTLPSANPLASVAAPETSRV